MYFYQTSSSKGQQVMRGPYLLPRSQLLNASDLGSTDFQSLSKSVCERSIYDTEVISLDVQLELRGRITTTEYTESFKSMQSGMTKSDWCRYLGITENQHKNFSTGRTKVSTSVLYSIENLLISHSYFLEMTAFALATLSFESVAVADMDRVQFGHHSIHFVEAMQKSRNLSLMYYWSRRTHIDICQAYIYLDTFSSRKEHISTWLKSPEYAAFQVAKSRAPAEKYPLDIDLSLRKDVMTLIKHTKSQNTQSDLADELSGLADRIFDSCVFGVGQYQGSDKIALLEAILGKNNSEHDLDYTSATEGLLIPDEKSITIDM